MRRLELSAALPASAEAAWAVLIDTEQWPSWGTLVVSARGAFVGGSVWEMELQGSQGRAARRMTPRFVSMVPGRRLVFETCVGHAALVRMTHIFDVEAAGPGRSVLRQTFEVSGALVLPLWPVLRRGMLQFAELGTDLAARLGGP
mgnify:CR=1 FL=1